MDYWIMSEIACLVCFVCFVGLVLSVNKHYISDSGLGLWIWRWQRVKWRCTASLDRPRLVQNPTSDRVQIRMWFRSDSSISLSGEFRDGSFGFLGSRVLRRCRTPWFSLCSTARLPCIIHSLTSHRYAYYKVYHVIHSLWSLQVYSTCVCVFLLGLLSLWRCQSGEFLAKKKRMFFAKQRI